MDSLFEVKPDRIEIGRAQDEEGTGQVWGENQESRKRAGGKKHINLREYNKETLMDKRSAKPRQREGHTRRSET